MSNVELTLRLLREVETVAPQGDGDGPDDVPEITPAALLTVLAANDFDLNAAIVDVTSGA